MISTASDAVTVPDLDTNLVNPQFRGWAIIAIVRDANRVVLVLSAAVLVLVIDRRPASMHVARCAHSSVE